MAHMFLLQRHSQGPLVSNFLLATPGRCSLTSFSCPSSITWSDACVTTGASRHSVVHLSPDTSLPETSRSARASLRGDSFEYAKAKTLSLVRRAESPILVEPVGSPSRRLACTLLASCSLFPLLLTASPLSVSAAPARDAVFSVLELPAGIRALDIRDGVGDQPAEGDKVAIHYYARLGAKQGWRFDSTYEHKDREGVPQPFEFTVGSQGVIQGLSIAVQGMRVGGVRRAVIPPPVAYQSTSDEPLPPNFFDRQRLFTTVFNPTRLQNGEGSTLGTVIFDIELVGIRSKAQTN